MRVPSASPSPKRPQVDEVYLAMAASDLNDAGMLYEPKAPDLYETRPQASFGGRSIVEANNPELGPTAPELREREKGFERQRQLNRKRR